MLTVAVAVVDKVMIKVEIWELAAAVVVMDHPDLMGSQLVILHLMVEWPEMFMVLQLFHLKCILALGAVAEVLMTIIHFLVEMVVVVEG
jgi:hypothetical protein